MTTQQFKPTLFIRIMNTIAAITFIGVVILMLYGLFNNIQNAPIFDGPFLLFGSCVSLFIIGWFAVILIGVLTSSPSISVNDQGFRLESLLGKSRWLPWEAISKVRKPFLPAPQIWFVGIRGLSWHYRINGLLYWMGDGAFLIGKTYKDYRDLLKILKAKRPDLFVG